VVVPTLLVPTTVGAQHAQYAAVSLARLGGGMTGDATARGRWGVGLTIGHLWPVSPGAPPNVPSYFHGYHGVELLYIGIPALNQWSGHFGGVLYSWRDSPEEMGSLALKVGFAGGHLRNQNGSSHQVIAPAFGLALGGGFEIGGLGLMTGSEVGVFVLSIPFWVRPRAE
jgi:hypothetical protein